MTHSHEEADTQILLHVIDVTTQGTSIRNIYLWSPNTDMFLLLMDFVVDCGNITEYRLTHEENM